MLHDGTIELERTRTFVISACRIKRLRGVRDLRPGPPSGLSSSGCQTVVAMCCDGPSKPISFLVEYYSVLHAFFSVYRL